MKLLRAMLAVYSRAFAGLPREVWLLCLTLFVNRAGTMVLPFLSLYLTREMELSAVAAGRIIACFVVGPVAGTTIYERFGAPALWYGIGGIGVVLWLGFSALAPAFRKPV